MNFHYHHLYLLRADVCPIRSTISEFSSLLH
jgi:hypothetical protein